MSPESTESTFATDEADSGSGDHDVPYTFGRRPRSSATYPFSTRQYARLLVLRGEFRSGLRSEGIDA